MLIVFTAMLTWLIYPFAWETERFGLEATIPTLALLLAINILFYRYRAVLKAVHPTGAPGIDVKQGNSNEEPRQGFEEPFIGLYAGLMFGGWTLLALLTVRWLFEHHLDLRILGVVSSSDPLPISASVGTLFCAVFLFVFGTEAFTSTNRRTRILARLELASIGLVMYGAFATLYSLQWYTTVPQLLGGGRPERVQVELDVGSERTDIASALPKVHCTRDETYWVCEDAFLVDTRSDLWIIADGSSSEANSIVVPKSSARLIRGRK